MNQTPSPERMIKGATRMLPFERVALVLQGGGALGAYQAGVYQAIHEANIDVHWLCGTSIGAINGALIAGNPPDKRVERLRDFWENVTKPPVRIPNLPWFSDCPGTATGTRVTGRTKSARSPPWSTARRASSRRGLSAGKFHRPEAPERSAITTSRR